VAARREKGGYRRSKTDGVDTSTLGYLSRS
jgi:hypothetical protein